MSQVLLRPQAEEDLSDIWFYIAIENGSPLNADRFIDRIHEKLNLLAETPAIGTNKDHYFEGLLQFVFGNYLIFYTPDKDGIKVARILHGARDIPAQF